MHFNISLWIAIAIFTRFYCGLYPYRYVVCCVLCFVRRTLRSNAMDDIGRWSLVSFEGRVLQLVLRWNGYWRVNNKSHNHVHFLVYEANCSRMLRPAMSKLSHYIGHWLIGCAKGHASRKHTHLLFARKRRSVLSKLVFCSVLSRY